jgi:hypothetical protein
MMRSFPEQALQGHSPKKNRYLWLVTVLCDCELCAKRKPSSSPPMAGNDYPDDNYDDVCDISCVHVVVNPHYGTFLTACRSIVKNIFVSVLDFSFGSGSLQGDQAGSIYFLHTERLKEFQECCRFIRLPRQFQDEIVSRHGDDSAAEQFNRPQDL